MVSDQPPSLMLLLDNVKHVEGVHLWHLLVEEFHMEHVITVSREARAVCLCATCFKQVVTLCSRRDVDALRERLDQDAACYHAAGQAAIVVLATKAYRSISVWANPTCGKFKGDLCRAGDSKCPS